MLAFIQFLEDMEPIRSDKAKQSANYKVLHKVTGSGVELDITYETFNTIVLYREVRNGESLLFVLAIIYTKICVSPRFPS